MTTKEYLDRAMVELEKSINELKSALEVNGDNIPYLTQNVEFWADSVRSHWRRLNRDTEN